MASCGRIGGECQSPRRTRHEEHRNTVQDGGEITLGKLHAIDCAATATDGHNAVVMLVRHNGETLGALLKRLDRAVAAYYDDGKTVDEVNGP